MFQIKNVSSGQFIRKYARMIPVVVVAGMALCAVIFVTHPKGQTKEITLVMNGQAKTVHTRQTEVQGLLSEQDIVLGGRDRLSVSRSSALHNGETIRIQHAFLVTVDDGGLQDVQVTAAGTVKEALQESNISLGPNDTVSPGLTDAIAPGSVITINRFNTKLITETETIPYKTVRRDDDKLDKGKEQVVQTGKEGTNVKTIRETYKDGELIASDIVSTKVQTPSQAKIVAVGTRNPVVILSASSPVVKTVTVNGISFGVKKVLQNVILTAYAADYVSTGKRPGDPEFGITYTGTHVTDGRTIAVDPSVIPLGWWVYIEGYGFRRAEDIGSGVKGKWIDMFISSESKVQKFGLKRGNTVYVIGPNKPDGVADSQ